MVVTKEKQSIPTAVKLKVMILKTDFSEEETTEITSMLHNGKGAQTFDEFLEWLNEDEPEMTDEEIYDLEERQYPGIHDINWHCFIY